MVRTELFVVLSFTDRFLLVFSVIELSGLLEEPRVGALELSSGFVSGPCLAALVEDDVLHVRRITLFLDSDVLTLGSC